MDRLGLGSPDEEGSPRRGQDLFLGRQPGSPSNGGMQIVNRNGILGVCTFFVAGTVNEIALHAATHKYRKKSEWVITPTNTFQLQPPT